MLNIRDDCVLWFVEAVFGEKWNLQLIIELINARINPENSLSYTELQSFLPEINTRVLSKRLTHLTELGVIDTIDNTEKPRKKRYKLNSKGEELIPILEQIRIWGLKYGVCKNEKCLRGICRHAISLRSFISES